MADSKAKSKTSKIDLDVEVTINGQSYGPGKGIEVPSESREDIERIAKDSAEAYRHANIHHGAVPAPAYPEEATAQTPTRPLGAPNLRQATDLTSGEPVGPVEVVDDKGVGHEVSDVEKVKAEFEAENTQGSDK